MKTWRRLRPNRAPKPIAILLLGLALFAGLGTTLGRPAAASTGAEVTLSPGPGAPSASGQTELQLSTTGVLTGSASVDNLPAQPYGSGKFYGVWFVRTDTGDKAFLGALVKDDSIIFSGPGEGDFRFAATHFTTGPDTGTPITFGSARNNLVIVLIENNINGLTPSPTGVAASGTF